MTKLWVRFCSSTACRTESLYWNIMVITLWTETGFEHTNLNLLAFSGFVWEGLDISRRNNRKICIIVRYCAGKIESVLLTYSHSCHSYPVWEIKGYLEETSLAWRGCCTCHDSLDFGSLYGRDREHCDVSERCLLSLWRPNLYWQYSLMLNFIVKYWS